MKKILDAWAILAWLQDEQPAANRVQAMLEAAQQGTYELGMSMMNIGEVYYRLVRLRDEIQAQAFLHDLKSMPLERLGVSNHLIIEAAKLKGQYKLSYADAFAVATAIKEKSPLVSGDPELKVFFNTEIVVIEWIRD